MRAVVTYSWSQLLPECQVPVSTAMLLMVPTTRVPTTGVNGRALVDVIVWGCKSVVTMFRVGDGCVRGGVVYVWLACCGPPALFTPSQTALRPA